MTYLSCKMMKRFRYLVLLFFVLIHVLGNSQSIVFFSNPSTIQTESVADTVATFIKIVPPLPQADSVAVVIRTGSASAADVINPPYQILAIPAFADSIPFHVQIFDDQLIENTEQLRFVLQSVSTLQLTADSVLLLSIHDNDLSISVTFNPPAFNVSEAVDTFQVCWQAVNPNSFPVRYYLRTLFPWDDPKVTLMGGSDYSFDWNFWIAPPGISTHCERFQVYNDTVPELTECVALIAVDSTNLYNVYDTAWICVEDDDYIPVTVSFDDTLLVVWEDTTDRDYKVPITFTNPNHFVIGFFPVDNGHGQTAENLKDYYFESYPFYYGQGVWHDTLRFRINNDELVEPTEDIYFHFKGDWPPSALSDTLFHVRILDTDTVAVSFLGAAFTYPESSGRCAVPIVNSSPAPEPMAVTIHYIGGDATKGVDFLYQDTTLVFLNNKLDTLPIYITILDDQIDEVNEQVLLELYDVQPGYVRQQVRQFAFIIVDDDTTAAGINTLGENEGRIFPIPFDDWLQIEMKDQTISEIVLWDAKGVEWIRQSVAAPRVQLNTAELPHGVYLAEVHCGDNIFRKKIVK